LALRFAFNLFFSAIQLDLVDAIVFICWGSLMFYDGGCIEEVTFVVCLFVETVQRMERSGGGSQQRRISAISHKLQLTDYCLAGLDSTSHASLIEVDQHCSFMTCWASF
jgi:hypothetical protein